MSDCRRWREYARTASALLLLVPAAANAAADTDSTTHTIASLENGLRVVVACVPGARLAEVRIFQAITAAHEPPQQEGIAHLVEHLSFDAVGAGPDSSVARSLALFSCYANASTGPWGVEYETVCLPSLLPQVLAVEARRLNQLAPTAEAFEREQRVVREEIAMRARRSASLDLVGELFRAAYAGGPYGAERTGTDSSVSQLTVQDVVAFHRTARDPRTMVVSIEAPLPVGRVLQLARASFGSLVGDGDVVPLPPVGDVTSPRTTPVLDRNDVLGLTAAIGFRLPRATADQKLMVAMLEELLRRQKLVCGIVPVPGEALLHVGVRMRYMAPPEGADPAEFEPDELGKYAWAHLWEVVQKATDAGLHPKGFEELKTWAAQQGRGDGGPRNATTLTLARDLLAGDDLRWLADVDSLIAALDLPKFAAYVRAGTRRVSVKGIVHGRDSGRPQPLQLAGRFVGEQPGARLELAGARLDATAIAPILEAYRQAPRRRIEQTTLSNGIPVLHVALPHALETFVGGVRTYAPPKWAQSDEQAGITLLYPSVASYAPKYDEEGAQPLPYFARFRATPVCFEFDAEGSTPSAAAIASTLAQRLAQPELSVQRWTFELRHAATTVDLQQRPPSIQAAWSRFAALLGGQHPLLGTWAADPHGVRKLDYERLRSAHLWMTRTGNLRLLSAGGGDLQDALRALEPAFARCPGPDARDLPVPLTGVLQGVVGRVIPAFDRRDCAVVLSMPPVAWEGPETWSWEERALVREVVRERIARRLREQEGLSYWIGVEEELAGASFVLQVSCSTFCQSVGTALAMIRHELRSLADQVPTADDVARARLKLAGSVARQLESPESAFGFLRAAARGGPVPADPVLAVLDADPERIATLLQRCIQPERFAFTVEGPILEEAIEELQPQR